MTVADQSPLPRVLLLSNEPPHTGAAGAIVFHRLFRDYPADRLLVIGNQAVPAAAGRLGCRYVHLPLAADRLNRTRFWSWRAILRCLGATGLVPLGAVARALQGFLPEVVVTLMQDAWYYELAARFARRRGLPLVLFVHDLPAGFAPVPSWLAARQRDRDRAIYRQAAVRLCVSRGMAGWFEAEYGLSGDVLPPPREDHPPAQPPTACRTLKAPGRLTLGYAGGLHYGYGEQLLRMLPVLRETGTRLEYFGPQPTGVVAGLGDATDVVRFNGYAPNPADAWRALLGRCDAVLQPYRNPPGAHERQYRTHFPSKLGDCLSLGLPLLITGPEYASGVAWCAGHPDCALTVTDPGSEALRTALLRLRDDAGLRERLAAGAQSAAQAFDAATLRLRVHRLLLSARAAHGR
ncbi:MAG: glycosyltransferase [Verrucomicrobiota bacterium]